MGLIEQQATRNAIYSYLGAGLGFLSVLLQSHIFTADENGLFRILVSFSILIAQFSTLGFSTVTTKFFPYFKSKKTGNNGFLRYPLVISIIGFIICFVIFKFFEDKIIEHNIEKSSLIVDYLFYVIPLSFFTLFFFVFDVYLRSCMDSVSGSLSKDLFQRVLIIITIGLFYFGVLNFKEFMLVYIVSLCVPTLILLYKIIDMGEWKIKRSEKNVDPELTRKMFNLAFFSFFSVMSGVIIVFVDVVMVNYELGLAETGVYSISFYFGSIILIPFKSIARIASSMIAEAFKENNLDSIRSIYIKSSNSLLTIGLFLFICIAINIDNIMQFLPATYESGKYVILLISLGSVVELGTGMNQLIILNSKYYYYDTIIVVLIIFTTVYSNYLLIPIYGISGAALATAGTISIGNLLRYLFIYWKYKIQPFEINTVIIIGISTIAFGIGYTLPGYDFFVVDMILRSSVIAIVFIGLLLKLNAAPEINNKIRKIVKLILKLLKEILK